MFSNNIGLYIHIPFCRSKCPYCDFFSMRSNERDYADYTEHLKKSIVMWSGKLNRAVDTIYFGGGTPGILGAELLSEILKTIKSNFSVTDNAEITMETNPALSFDFEKAAYSGFNRVSLGVQSANDKELRLLGRLHKNEDVINTVRDIKNAGISNISLDLMMGIPEQTQKSLQNSIDFCSCLDVQHISSYILKIEPGTVFDKKRNLFKFPSDDDSADLYLSAVDYLGRKGFEQYEVSNFCKPGFESRHNTKYWILDDYLGLGPAAHSFLNGRRFYYERSIEKFANNEIVDEGTGGSKEEFIMLNLRMKKGISPSEYKKAFGEELPKDFLKKVNKYIKFGLMEYNESSISFTAKGFLVSNTILAELI